MKKKRINITRFIYMVIALSFFMFSILLIYNYYNNIMSVYRPSDILSVKENSEIKYSVCVKEEYVEVYGSACLAGGGRYAFEHVDYIEVNNIYTTTFTERLDANYDYKAIATLYVRERSGTGGNDALWHKEYALDEKTKGFNASTTVNSTFNLKLQDYANDAHAYVSSLVNTQSFSFELKVDYIVKLAGMDDRFASTHTETITIPLTDTFSPSISNNPERITDHNVSNKNLFTIGFFANSLNIILCYVIIFVAIKSLFAANTIYKQIVNKYLKTYDDIIINTDSPMDFDKYETLMINEFKEILDLSTNTNIPIMFYENKQGALFYIFYNNMIYMHVVSREI